MARPVCRCVALVLVLSALNGCHLFPFDPNALVVTFAVQPAGANGGTPFATQPVIELRAPSGTLLPIGGMTVAISLSENPAGGTLSGTLTVPMVDGRATFTDLAIDKAGSGYTLRAVVGGIRQGTSAPFAVVSGPPVRVAFVSAPTEGIADVPFETQPVLELRDAGGNPAVGAGALRVALADNPGMALLNGVLSAGTTTGRAQFTHLAISKSGTGYTLAASAMLAGAVILPGDTSPPINVRSRLDPTAWVQRATLPGGPLAGAANFSLNDKLYVGWGIRLGYEHDFYEYDPLQDTWKTVFPPAFGVARANAIGFAIGDYAYTGLGQNFPSKLNDFWRFDPLASVVQRWVRMADFPGTGRALAVSFVIGEKAYVTGGTIEGDVWEYDPALNAWSRKADYPGGCSTPELALTINGRGYAGLGAWTGECRDWWEYHPLTDSWEQKADLPGDLRTGAVGFAVEHDGFVAAGRYLSTQFPPMHLTDIWKYDSASDSWSLVPSRYPGDGRVEMVAGVVGDRVFMGLGTNEQSQYDTGRFADFWEFRP